MSCYGVVAIIYDVLVNLNGNAFSGLSYVVDAGIKTDAIKVFDR